MAEVQCSICGIRYAGGFHACPHTRGNALGNWMAPAPLPQLTETDVRRIVREEIAKAKEEK